MKSGMEQKIISIQYIYTVHIYVDGPTNESQGELKGDFASSQGDCLN